MSSVFISYAREDNKPNDQGFVTRLHASLVSSGHKVWIDKRNIRHGDEFWEAIRQGIIQSDVFLFVISPTSISSPYCGKELELAVELNKRLIPIMRIKEGLSDREGIGKCTWLLVLGS